MLDKKIFKDKMELLTRFYPTWNLKIEEQRVMSDWYEMFSDKTDVQFEKAITEHIKKEKFNPTVASINSHMNHNQEVVINMIDREVGNE